MPPAASLPLPRRAPSAPSRPLAPAPHPAQRVLKLPGHGTAPNASSSHTHPRRWPRRPSPDPRCPANPRPLRRGCPPSHKLCVSHPGDDGHAQRGAQTQAHSVLPAGIPAAGTSARSGTFPHLSPFSEASAASGMRHPRGAPGPGLPLPRPAPADSGEGLRASLPAR